MLLLGGAALLIRARTPTAQFQNVTRAAGIEFVHHKGNHGVPSILEEAGPGMAGIDWGGETARGAGGEGTILRRETVLEAR